MDQKRIDEVVAILSQEDTAGKPFAEAREILVQKGYTEQEIVQGVYQFPYDGKPNQPQATAKVTEYYAQHPAQADKVAKDILHDIGQRERERLVAYSLASEFGDKQTTSYYSVLAADEVGYPYYTMFFLGIVVAALGFKYRWLYYGPTVLGAVTSIYFSWLFWRRWRAARRQK